MGKKLDFLIDMFIDRFEEPVEETGYTVPVSVQTRYSAVQETRRRLDAEMEDARMTVFVNENKSRLSFAKDDWETGVAAKKIVRQVEEKLEELKALDKKLRTEEDELSNYFYGYRR